VKARTGGEGGAWRTRVILTIGAALALAALLTGGCGILDRKVCTDTDLSLPPIHVTDPKAPVLLTATLTAGDQPLVGGSVSFFIRTVAPARPGPESGFRTGSATSGSDGVARYSRTAGLTDVLLVGDRVTGYEAEFLPLTKISGVNYCGAKARGELRVQ